MNNQNRPFLLTPGRVAAALLFPCFAAPGFGGTPAPVAKAAPVSRMPEMPCAQPAYPKESLRNSSQGTVTMELLISPAGDVIESRVKTSSGYALLDAAALTATAKCKFLPLQENGKPVQAWVVTQYVWELDS